MQNDHLAMLVSVDFSVMEKAILLDLESERAESVIQGMNCSNKMTV
jgi:hypothetical protein